MIDTVYKSKGIEVLEFIGARLTGVIEKTSTRFKLTVIDSDDYGWIRNERVEYFDTEDDARNYFSQLPQEEKK